MKRDRYEWLVSNGMIAPGMRPVVEPDATGGHMSETIFPGDADDFRKALTSEEADAISDIDGAVDVIVEVREKLLWRVEQQRERIEELETALAAANAENEQLRETLDLWKRGTKA